MFPSKLLINFDVRHIYQNQNKNNELNCWYASAQMVLAFRSVIGMVINTSSNIDTLERYFRCEGIEEWEMQKFAAEVGLNSIGATDIIKSQDINGWEGALKKYGPLWIPIKKTQGNNSYNHIIVVRGATSDGLLIIDDPEDLVATTTPANELNSKVYWNLQFLYKLGAGVAL